MPKLPRNISSVKLAKLLKKYGYTLERQTGSHIRLVSKYVNEEHKVTIPAHAPLKIGTLNNILREISNYIGATKEEIAKNLFGSNNS